jgi:hypothetical protein
VKMSYFPNWDANGASGPYRVAPNFMVVVPEETHVELTYGRTGVEYVSYLLTLLGVVGLVLLWRRPTFRFSPEPERPRVSPRATDVPPGPFSPPGSDVPPGPFSSPGSDVPPGPFSPPGSDVSPGPFSPPGSDVPPGPDREDGPGPGASPGDAEREAPG